MASFWRFSSGVMVGTLVGPVLKPAARGLIKSVIKAGLLAKRGVKAQLAELVEAAKEELADAQAEVAAHGGTAKSHPVS